MSQTTRTKTEFLGLHDPYAARPAGAPRQPPQPAPLIDKEKAGELVRAGATLTVILLLLAVAVTALY
jgi:hypothetical protein